MMDYLHPFLETLIPIANALALTIGPNCEIAIHDLSRPHNSIYYITNGEITGRHSGDSLSPLFTNLIELAIQNQDSLINYHTVENNRSLKCTKVLIRDENKEVIGCFCVNIAIDEYLCAKKLISDFCRTESIDTFHPQIFKDDNSTDQIDGMMKELISNTYNDFRKDKGQLSSKDRFEMVRFLDDKGVFRVKDAVDIVANTLKISKFTVYSYLNKLKETNGAAKKEIV